MVRQEQLAKMIQKELSRLFLIKSARWCRSIFVSVTMVELDGPCSMAKVYLSFALHEEQELETLFKKIISHKNTIKQSLSSQIAHKIRKVPDLQFHIDRSVTQGMRITALIAQWENPGNLFRTMKHANLSIQPDEPG